MRKSLKPDDDLIEQAPALTGTTEKAVLVREALNPLVQRETAHRPARLGRTEPRLKAASGRQPTDRP